MDKQKQKQKKSGPKPVSDKGGRGSGGGGSGSGSGGTVGKFNISVVPSAPLFIAQLPRHVTLLFDARFNTLATRHVEECQICRDANISRVLSQPVLCHGKVAAVLYTALNGIIFRHDHIFERLESITRASIAQRTSDITLAAVEISMPNLIRQFGSAESNRQVAWFTKQLEIATTDVALNRFPKSVLDQNLFAACHNYANSVRTHFQRACEGQMGRATSMAVALNSTF